MDVQQGRCSSGRTILDKAFAHGEKLVVVRLDAMAISYICHYSARKPRDELNPNSELAFDRFSLPRGVSVELPRFIQKTLQQNVGFSLLHCTIFRDYVLAQCIVIHLSLSRVKWPIGGKNDRISPANSG